MSEPELAPSGDEAATTAASVDDATGIAVTGKFSR